MNASKAALWASIAAAGPMTITTIILSRLGA
jgi:hypothetical protein